ncbi:MAG: RdgB/HAM1 family non-canonical purine NTP pyrophosphatase [Alistipes sp.]|nr:RdgB/HAM1 family non-canonical purine NTP pyrophosphatase [Alistipes sp.]
MKIVFATHNPHKLEEVQAVLGSAFTLVTPDQLGVTEEIPEDQTTLEGNALQKARYLYRRCGTDCFADDTGLEVEALNGAPGVYSARYAGPEKRSADNIALLLERLHGKANRKARFRTVIALIFHGEEYLFEGKVEGQIIDVLQGSSGFGYDPVFVPDGYTTTFAQMSADQKNAISHRGRAVAALVAFLHDRHADL